MANNTVTQKRLITRSEYMAGDCSHDTYYAQFGEHLTDLVAQTIGVDRILKSTDPHLNDIPLKRWDSLAPAVRWRVGRLIGEANETGGVSLSDCVCAAKSAARLIQEKHKGQGNG